MPTKLKKKPCMRAEEGKDKMTQKDLLDPEDLFDITPEEFNYYIEDHDMGHDIFDKENAKFAQVEYDSVSGLWNVYSDQDTLIKAYPSKRGALLKKYQLEWYARKKAEQGQITPGQVLPIQSVATPPPVKKAPEPAVDYPTGSGTHAPATNINDPWEKANPNEPAATDYEKPLRDLSKGMRQQAVITSPKQKQSQKEIQMPDEKEDLYKSNNINYNNIMDNVKQPVTNIKQPVTENNIPPGTPDKSAGPIQPLIEETGKIKETITLFRDGEWDFTKDMNFKFKVDDKFKKSILHNFVDNVRGQRIPIVDKHSTAEKAYGWLENIWETEGGIEAKPRYNPRGIQTLEGEEFGYQSPQVDFDYYDPETKKKYGPTLIEITLTNGPRIKRSSSVLKGFSETSKGGEKIMTPEEKLAKMEALATEFLVLVGNTDVPPAVPAEPLKASEPVKTVPVVPAVVPAVETQEDMKAMLSEMAKQMKADASKEEKETVSNTESHKDSISLAEVTTLKNVCNTLEQRCRLSEDRLAKVEAEKIRLSEERAEEKNANFFNQLVGDGKMKPVNIPGWAGLLRDMRQVDVTSNGNLKLSEETKKAGGFVPRIQELLKETTRVWEPNKEYGKNTIPSGVELSEEAQLHKDAIAMAKEQNISYADAVIKLSEQRPQFSFIPEHAREGRGF